MSITHEKQITETDVYLWAAVSQDFSPMHVDEPFAARTPAGGRIGHGVLTLALMAQAARSWHRQSGLSHVEQGYSHVRFTRPVRLGDLVRAGVEPDAGDGEEGSLVLARNQRQEVVGVASLLARRHDGGDQARLSEDGETAWLSRTIAASDVAIHDFATGIAADAIAGLGSPAAERAFGEQEVPPVLAVGLMSGASTLWCEQHERADAFSYGYDNVVFHRPLRVGETLRIGYLMEHERPEENKLFSRVEVIDERGELAASATHVLWHRGA